MTIMQFMLTFALGEIAAAAALFYAAVKTGSGLVYFVAACFAGFGALLITGALRATGWRKPNGWPLYMLSGWVAGVVIVILTYRN